MSAAPPPLCRDGNWVRVIAPAKINLFLHITGRRDNGYHELESLFVFSEFGDQVSVRRADKLSLEVLGPFASELDGDVLDNLVMKAARALQAHVGVQSGAEIVLEKNLPIAAGIGGGSSDAAACLRGLIELWDASINERELTLIAAELGADVPACLSSAPKFVAGIGELVQPANIPSGLFVLLVNPRKNVSTPTVFKAFAETEQPFSKAQGNCPDWSGVLGAENDLQAAAIETCDEIGDMLGLLAGLPDTLKVGLSGSGATCFALFDNFEPADFALKTLQKSHPHWWVMTSEISR